MSSTNLFTALLHYIENHIYETLDQDHMEQSLGTSYRNIREIIQKHTGSALKKYTDNRKIAYAAFDLIHTDIPVTDLAFKYSFSSVDIFTRMFRRETGSLPSNIRKKGGLDVKIQPIGLGIFAPVIQTDIHHTESCSGAEEIILYGVPKVEFISGKCTPFPACLESIGTYLGKSAAYPDLMAYSGAAYRLRWHRDGWNGSNVDLRNITPSDPYAPFQKSLAAAGFRGKIIEKKNSSKREFASSIKASLEQGLPVIGLGIAGPPEACIITGINTNTDTLYGWSYFQQIPEFAESLSFLDNGYFFTDKWWGNPGTEAIILLQNDTAVTPSLTQAISSAHEELTRASAGNFLCGQAAYDSWIKALGDDSSFPDGTAYPALIEKVMCQNDMETVLGESRYWAGVYFKSLSQEYETISSKLERISALFSQISLLGQGMTELRHGNDMSENTFLQFCNRKIREQLIEKIRKAQQLEKSIATQAEILLRSIGQPEN